jgi:hypothetical protein
MASENESSSVSTHLAYACAWIAKQYKGFERYGMNACELTEWATTRNCSGHRWCGCIGVGARERGGPGVYRDKLSEVSTREQRPGLAALLDYARPGDSIVLVGIDRLGRNAA